MAEGGELTRFARKLRAHKARSQRPAVEGMGEGPAQAAPFPIPEPEVQAATAPAPVQVAPPPPRAEPETLEELAQEAGALIRSAMADGAVQQHSVQLILGCHAAMAVLLPAHAAELKRALLDARQPMTAAERDAWMRETAELVLQPVRQIEALHADVGERAERGAAKGQMEATKRLVRTFDRALARQWAMVVGGAFVAGALLAGGVVYATVSREVAVVQGGFTLPLGSARAWLDIIRENPEPEKVLRNEMIRQDNAGGGWYYSDVSLWKSRNRLPPR